jgi:hypothetical protein
MRRTTNLVFAFALVAPLAFAQAKTPKKTQDATTERVTTEMSSSKATIGTVVSFTPAKTIVVPPSPIVVQSSPDVRPISYVLGKKVRFVDQTGKAVDPSKLRSGARVHLEFDRAGAVKRVVVVERG